MIFITVFIAYCPDIEDEDDADDEMIRLGYIPEYKEYEADIDITEIEIYQEVELKTGEIGTKILTKSAAELIVLMPIAEFRNLIKKTLKQYGTFKNSN
jgi:hypothetical protein